MNDNLFLDALYKKYQDIIKEYSSSFEQLNSDAQARVVFKQYAKGGTSIHRGYYCPSPIFDIIIGNCNRGRLLKNKTGSFNYEYCFDINNKLICVNVFTHEQNKHEKMATEFLLYHDDVVLSLYYEDKAYVTAITECKYLKSKILSYDYVLCSWGDKSPVYEITTENYEYADDQLASAFVIRNVMQGKYLEQTKYIFEHDENGFLSSYYTEEYDSKGRKPDFWDGHVFSITIKRKV